MAKPMPSATSGRPAAAEPAALLAEAKRILRTSSVGALATLSASDGFPFSSLAALATDFDACPLLLTSALSAHSRHMEADPRVSILMAVQGRGDPLAHPRLTVSGRASKVSALMRERVRARFLSRHPKATLYVDFPDFSFWRVEPAAIHFNGGFAKAAAFDPAELKTRTDDASELAVAEADALAHLNSEHRETLALLAKAHASERGERWRAVSLDPEGLDLAARDKIVRLLFPERVRDVNELRSILVGMSRRAQADSEVAVAPSG